MGEEEGLVATAGAEFMALETTEEAGMCLAFRSMLGLVGSSMKGMDASESSGAANGATRRPACSPTDLSSLLLAAGGSQLSVSFPLPANTKFICRSGGCALRPVGGFCRSTTSSHRSSARLLSVRCSRGGSGGGGGAAGAAVCAMLKVGSPPKVGSRKDRACSSPVRRWKDGL